MTDRSGDRLQRALGAAPPPGVQALPADDREALAALIEAARSNQAADLEVAIEGVLKHVAFPVRPIARRMLKG